MMIATVLLMLQTQPADAHLIGRFLKVDSGFACDWPGSAIQFNTQSSTVSVKLKASSPNDRWQVDVDGTATEVLKLDPTKGSYTVNLPDPKRHTVTLVRRTECFSGNTVFEGVSGGTATKGLKRKIEVIGDSISAGYGVDGKSKAEHFSVETSNAYLAYGWVTARLVHAEPTIIAWSGRKMWPDNTVPEIYDYILPAEKQGLSETPDDPSTQAVLINLATNDFGQGVPDKFKWCNSYAAFVRKVRTRFPNAHIYLATGSMMTDNWPPEKKVLTVLKGYLDSIQTQVNDPKVHRIDFAPQDEAVDGIGSDYHPNQKTQAKMGKVFADALKHDLGW